MKMKMNLMKINADKFHLLVSTNNTVKIKVGHFDVTKVKVRSYYKFNLTINSLSMITFQNYVKRLVEKFTHCQE